MLIYNMKITFSIAWIYRKMIVCYLTVAVKNRTLKKEPKSLPKVIPQGPQTGPSGSPNPVISAKKLLPKSMHKKSAKSHANEGPQDPFQPQKLCSRAGGSVVFTFSLVAQKYSKMTSNVSFWGPLWDPKWLKNP